MWCMIDALTGAGPVPYGGGGGKGGMGGAGGKAGGSEMLRGICLGSGLGGMVVRQMNEATS